MIEIITPAAVAVLSGGRQVAGGHRITSRYLRMAGPPGRAVPRVGLEHGSSRRFRL